MSHSAGDESKTVGPVRNLEDHLSDDWWQSLFGPLYLETDADVLAPENTRAEVDRLIALLDLHADDRVLDLCCGQGRHALELARRGFRCVEGLDQSPFLVEKAREAAAEAGLEVSFREGDSRGLPYDDHTFDVVLVMGNSFGYFAAEDDNREMLEEVRRVLKEGGQLLLDVTSGTYMQRRFEPRSWEWLDTDRLACRERELTDHGKRLVSREVVIDAEEGIVADQFYAERLYTRVELERLLHEAGFGEVGFADGSKTHSSRGQDLGMMARRVMVAATSREGPEGEAPARHVAVVLGDPRLPDLAKKDGRFGQADFEVIRRLKETLETLEGYHFTYLDDHSCLLEDLQLVDGEVDLVFNLCDEGFRNEARQELHVPALLEMLEMPYTGGNPQCLSACYDKSLVRGVAREMDVPVADGFMLAPGDELPRELPVGYPVIAKPNAADSSIGITRRSVAHGRKALEEAVASVREVAGEEAPVLVEAFLTGKDLTVSLIGNGEEQRVLPITEDDYSHLPAELPPLCGYEAKWLPDSPYYLDEDHTVEAELTSEQREVIVQSSRRLFERLGCRDYARFDWRLCEAGRPHLLEANPNPGWCWDGHLALQAKKDELTYGELLRHILEAAARRYQLARR